MLTERFARAVDYARIGADGRQCWVAVGPIQRGPPWSGFFQYGMFKLNRKWQIHESFHASTSGSSAMRWSPG